MELGQDVPPLNIPGALISINHRPNFIFLQDFTFFFILLDSDDKVTLLQDLLLLI